MTTPILSIVIVEYKSIPEIVECVQSISTRVSFPYEVIISSNSCYTESEKATIPTLDHVRWVFNHRNGGFAYAMNRGLRVAQGDYLVIMNSDCILLDPLDGMIAFMQQHPEVGAIAPQLIDQDGVVQDSARPYVSLSGFCWRQLKRIFRGETVITTDSMDYSRIQTIDWVIGAFTMVSRMAYQATGGLSERYFMYAEDLDWCTRIHEEGYEVVYYPRTHVEYKGTRRARKDLKYAGIFIKSHFKYWSHFGFFSGYPKHSKLYYA